MPTIFVPAEPYPKKANDNIRSSDWNAAIDEVSRLSATTQNIDRDTFSGPLTINGALTVNGEQTVNGILGVGGYTRISEATGAANFAAFGANAYVTAGGWNPVDTAYPGAGFLVGTQIGLPEFRFFVMDAGGQNARNIAMIGAEGLTVTGGINGPITVKGNMTVTGVLTASGGINGPITVEGPLTVDTTLTVAGAVTANAALTVKGALTASGGLAVTGNETVSGLLTASAGLTVNGGLLTAGAGLTVSGALTASNGINGPLTIKGALTVDTTLTVTGAVTANAALTVSGLLTASNGLTVNVALLTANKGLTVNGGLLTASGGLAVTGNETVSGGLTVTGDETVSGKLTVNGTTLSELKGPVTVSGLLTASNGLTVSGALTASNGINGPLTVKGDLTIQGVATVDGLSMSISETTVLATNVTGPWASFGSNAYYRGNQWKLAKTAQAGVCLVMSSGGGTNRQFAFCRMDANSTTATDLVTIGTGGLTVTGDETVSGKLTVNGTTLSELKGPVTVSGLLTASNGLTVNVALLTANKGLTVNGGLLTASAGLTVTGNQTVNGALTVTGALTASGGINGSLTVNGALTVNTTLTVTGALTANSTLTVTGAVTASNGINAPLTIKGAVDDALTIEGSLVKVRGVTTVGTDTQWGWSSFGCNLWAKNGSSSGGDWKLVDSSKPGVCLYMGTANAGEKEFRFVRMGANLADRQDLATIGTGGLKVSGGISGLNGPLTINDSFLSIAETTVLSMNAAGGPWASFGSNAYYHGNQWKLANTAQPGVCLQMSGQGGGNSEFRFARVEANSTTATNLVTMGREGIVVHNGKKVSTAGEFLYMIRGRVHYTGSVAGGTGFTVRKLGTGSYIIDCDPGFSSDPIAVATQYNPDYTNKGATVVIVSLSNRSIQIKVGTSDGTLSDASFCFIAIGPRTT